MRPMASARAARTASLSATTSPVFTRTALCALPKKRFQSETVPAVADVSASYTLDPTTSPCGRNPTRESVRNSVTDRSLNAGTGRALILGLPRPPPPAHRTQ